MSMKRIVELESELRDWQQRCRKATETLLEKERRLDDVEGELTRASTEVGVLVGVLRTPMTPGAPPPFRM